MSDLILLSPSEQVAGHLRKEIMRGKWIGIMPGAPTLAAELGIDSKTVGAALNLLEREGILEGQGIGRHRKIAIGNETRDSTSLRIAILDYEKASLHEDYMVGLRHRLVEEGHQPFNPPKTLTELGMNIPRIRRMVKDIEADAWIVCAGSRDVLKWFSEKDKPTFALFGRRRTLPIAGVGPDHEATGRLIAKRLIELGHQRIVILERESQRAGGPGQFVRVMFDEMTKHGLSSGPYNLPEWNDSSDGLHRVLDGLFEVTPPTAFIIDEPFIFHAVKDHLARRGIYAPDDVSLICSDPDQTFTWLRPSVAHVRWDHRPIVRRTIDWVANISQGKQDLRQTLTKAEFVEGGTIGRVSTQQSKPSS